jgi:hypothetical protein
MFSLLLMEKKLLNLDATLVVVVKIEKNVMANHQVQPYFLRLFDPQARRVKDPPIKGLQEPKEEVEASREESPSKIVELVIPTF